MRAFLMCDMKPVAGLGHAVRCAALAEALVDIGFDFAPVYDLDSVKPEDIAKAAPDVVVFDSYKLWDDAIDETLGPQLGNYRPLLVAIVDMPMQNHPVDLLVNGCASMSDVAYTKATRVLQGPSYALIRKAFSPGPVVTRRGVIDFREVQGMRAPHLAGRMRACEVGISWGGMRALELAATGTPAVLVEQVENQRLNIDGLTEAACAVLHDPEAYRSPEAQASALDAVVRVSMAARGPDVVDGRGSERVAKAIMEML